MTTSQQIYTSRMTFYGTTTTSAGIVDATKIPKTKSNGKLDNSFLEFNGQISTDVEFYPGDVVWIDDGTANNVTVRDGFDTTGKIVYKECIGNDANQDLDLIITYKLPSQFVEFNTDAVQIITRTSSATASTSDFALTIWRNTSSLYTLASFGNSTSWMTTTINKTSLATATAGDTLVFVVKAQMDLSAWCRLAVLKLSYIRSI